MNTLDCLWTVNVKLYCVFRIPNLFFWHSNNLIAQNQRNIWKRYEHMKNIWKHFFHSHNLIARNHTTFEKHVKKMCINQIFTWKLSTTSLQHNLPTIHSIQWYNGFSELTNENNLYKCIGFLHENYQQQAYSTLLYNRPAIHSIQWYNGLCELIN